MISRAKRLRPELPDELRDRVTIEWFERLGSTNDYLLSQAAPAPSAFHVAIADEQISGRGRGQNRWVSGKRQGLWLSFATTFSPVPAGFEALTLALGVGVVAGLQQLGAAELALKWPNDVMAGDRKLGGILVESRGRGSSATAVCGIGINVQTPTALLDNEQALPPTGLASVLSDGPSMERLAGTVLSASIATCDEFAARGPAAFMERWSALDWLRDKRVVVNDGNVAGVAAGIDDRGRLTVDDGSQRRVVTAGTVRVIAAA